MLIRGLNDIAKVYLDGTLEIEARMALSDPAIRGELYIGGNPDGPGLEGRIDEIAVYDRVLTAEEVLEHYRLGLTK